MAWLRCSDHPAHLVEHYCSHAAMRQFAVRLMVGLPMSCMLLIRLCRCGSHFGNSALGRKGPACPIDGAKGTAAEHAQHKPKVHQLFDRLLCMLGRVFRGKGC